MIFRILLFVVLSPGLLHSQPFKEYAKHIHQAELAIIESNYGEALHYYDSAFSIMNYSFAKDRFNAAVAAALNENYARCKFELLKVRQAGGGLEIIHKNTALQAFLSSKEGEKFLKEAANTRVTYNSTARRFADSIMVADQLFRTKAGSYEVYADTIWAIDKSNTRAVNQFIKEHGFPGEDMIGVDEYLSYPLLGFFIHRQNGTGYTYDFSSIISNAYYAGKIDSHLAAGLIEKLSGKTTWGEMDGGIVTIFLDTIPLTIDDDGSNRTYENGRLGYFFSTPEKEQKMDSLRLDFGLERQSDLRKKMLFNHKRNYILTLPYNSSEWVFSTVESYNQALQNFIPLE